MLRRLKVALLAAVVIPALLLVGGAWDERTQLLHAAEGDALATVAAAREHAVKTIETQELLIHRLDSRIQGMSLAQIEASSAAISAEIMAMHAGMPEVSAIAVTDAEGRPVASSDSDAGNGSAVLADQNYWNAEQEAGRNVFVGRTYVGSSSKRLGIGISRQRTTRDGHFDGVLYVGVAASYFWDFWTELAAGRQDAVIALVRLDGDALAQLPPADDALSGGAWQANAILQHVEAGAESGVFRTSAAPDKIERLYAWSRVGRYPLVIGYGIETASVTAPWRRHLIYVGGAGVLATAALVLAIMAIMQQADRATAEQEPRLELDQAGQQRQRLEILGRLTAGIAHDFANILQTMAASASQFKRAAAQPERVRSLAVGLADDVDRGMSLMQRILDLVRQNAVPGVAGHGGDKRTGASSVTDPADALARLYEMLPRLLGSRHQLRYEPAPHLPAFVCGNRSDLELAVMNLLVNARDAMPDGGEIILRAVSAMVGGGRHGGLDDDPPEGLAPGPYVRISVEDSGTGMSPEVLARAGSAFFTTKSRERGTGLGLAGARGFAERSGGVLRIRSAAGRGTSVTLWLPAATQQCAREPVPAEAVASS